MRTFLIKVVLLRLLTYSDFTNTNFEFRANVFAFWVRKVIFKNKLSIRIQILCVKSSEVRYHLELKANKDHVLKK